MRQITCLSTINTASLASFRLPPLSSELPPTSYSVSSSVKSGYTAIISAGYSIQHVYQTSGQHRPSSRRKGPRYNNYGLRDQTTPSRGTPGCWSIFLWLHVSRMASVTIIICGTTISWYCISKEESKAIVRKFDLHILPLAWWAYLFNSLDRNNASNAKSAGMTGQSIMTHKFNWSLTIS